ncbi:MAG: guanylate kinase [Eubacterium sp.]|nr:guanylate kinase [Eubacterium sp.]
MSKGMLVVFSAPSGCGKDTVFKEICKLRDDVVESVSATTRKPRDGEVDGVNYFFVSENEFKKMIDNGGLLEFNNYNGCYYGTPVKGINNAVEQGKVCFLIIDVNGAEKIKELYPDCLSIFLLPPSIEELEKRLRGRDSDGDEIIKSRLDIAMVELSYKDKYDYQIINDDLNECVDNINKILNTELRKRG